MQKEHSFLQNPTESNWCNFKHDFTKSVDKLRHVVLKSNKDLTEHDNLPEDPTKQSKLGNRSNHKYLLRPTRKKKKLNVGGLELIGMDIFRSEN